MRHQQKCCAKNNLYLLLDPRAQRFAFFRQFNRHLRLHTATATATATATGTGTATRAATGTRATTGTIGSQLLGDVALGGHDGLQFGARVRERGVERGEKGRVIVLLRDEIKIAE